MKAPHIIWQAGLKGHGIMQAGPRGLDCYRPSRLVCFSLTWLRPGHFGFLRTSIPPFGHVDSTIGCQGRLRASLNSTRPMSLVGHSGDQGDSGDLTPFDMFFYGEYRQVEGFRLFGMLRKLHLTRSLRKFWSAWCDRYMQSYIKLLDFCSLEQGQTNHRFCSRRTSPSFAFSRSSTRLDGAMKRDMREHLYLPFAPFAFERLRIRYAANGWQVQPGQSRCWPYAGCSVVMRNIAHR